MTNLYLMRHCQPTPGLPMDGSRPLTAEGVKQAGQMATWLVGQIGRVDYVVTSPFLRASQTAQIMGDALGAPVVASTSALQPEGEPEEMWKEIVRLAVDSKDVLVIGHDPSINELLGWLCNAEWLSIRLEHGSVAWLRVTGKAGKLQYLVTPAIVGTDQDEADVLEAARALVESLA